MAWADSESEQNRRRFLSVEEVMAQYEREDQPLDELVISTVLEPLAGTSFLDTAIHDLRRADERNTAVSGKGITANALFVSFFDSPWRIEVCTDTPRQNEATLALSSFFPSALTHDEVVTFKGLSPDEMMLYELRWDEMFYDLSHTRRAFNHSARQWRFYKGGQYLQTIPSSAIDYQDQKGKLHLHTLLPEGYYPTPFFTDASRPGLASVHPKLQVFKQANRLLYISPQFSFEAARKK